MNDDAVARVKLQSQVIKDAERALAPERLRIRQEQDAVAPEQAANAKAAKLSELSKKINGFIKSAPPQGYKGGEIGKIKVRIPTQKRFGIFPIRVVKRVIWYDVWPGVGLTHHGEVFRYELLSWELLEGLITMKIPHKEVDLADLKIYEIDALLSIIERYS